MVYMCTCTRILKTNNLKLLAPGKSLVSCFDAFKYLYFRLMFFFCHAGSLRWYCRNSPYNWIRASFSQYMTYCLTGRLKRNCLPGYEQTSHWSTFPYQWLQQRYPSCCSMITCDGTRTWDIEWTKICCTKYISLNSIISELYSSRYLCSSLSKYAGYYVIFFFGFPQSLQATARIVSWNRHSLFC